MSLKKYTSIILVNFMLIISLFVIDLNAAPHWGDKFQLKQPDGSKVTVLVWGDEFYQDVESVDGYTLIRDPSTGWICYAELSSDGSEYISTEQVYRMNEQDSSTLHSKDGEGKIKQSLEKKLRINKKSIREKAALKREELLGEDFTFDSEESRLAWGGNVTGLTVLIDFPDEPATVSQSEINNFCNQSGYSNNGNNGSVKDYFYDISNKNLIYQNVVTGYVRMPNNKSYYDTPNSDNSSKTRELITGALNQLKAQGFNFSQISAGSAGSKFTAVNILYAGNPEHGWSNGLWPHYGYLNYNIDGVEVEGYQMTNIGSSLQLGTFVHENGHMLCLWNDLYAYDGHDRGTGDYCLMSSGHGGNPQMANPHFRSNLGWMTTIDISSITQGTTVSLTSNGHTAYRLRYGQELFYIEARIKEGRSANIPDEGLAIWHINMDGKNTYARFTNEVSVEQADGLFSLENNENAGGPGDLYHSGYKDSFNSSTNPNSNWYDGSQSGLSISNISAVGTSMSFTVGESQNSCSAPVINVTGTSTNSISVSWNDAGANSYTVYYKTQNGSWNQIASGVTAANYVVTGLTANTTYDIAVVSVCADGSQEYNIITATTDDSQNDCSAPVTTITNSTASTLSLTWNDVGATTYTVYYRASSGSWQNVSGLNTTSYVLTGLTANTAYDIAVLAYCPDGSNLYEIITAETDGETGLSTNDVLGQYVRQPPTNGWHTGVISASGDTLKWTNEAGTSWTLIPDLDNEQLLTTGDCPYPGNNFTLEVEYNGDGSVDVTGFMFLNELYSR